MVIVDDILATGGTVEALIKLAQEEGATVVAVLTLIELKVGGARCLLGKYIPDVDILSIVEE